MILAFCSDTVANLEDNFLMNNADVDTVTFQIHASPGKVKAYQVSLCISYMQTSMSAHQKSREKINQIGKKKLSETYL